MNHKFDELAKGLAQSVTRRGALRRFGVGLAGIALATLGVASKAEARQCRPAGSSCKHDRQCCSGYCYFNPIEPGQKFGVCF